MVDRNIRENGKEHFLSYANKKISIYDLIWNYHYKKSDINQPSSIAQLDKVLRNQSDKIKDNTLKKYTKEFFLNKLSQLTPLTNLRNKKQAINFKVYRETKPLNLTKEIFSNLHSHYNFELIFEILSHFEYFVPSFKWNFS